MKKSQAFTLAEVLITLVIIGVIAAMTIPTLMGNTNEQDVKTRAKKAISMINQAIKLEETLYGHNPSDYRESLHGQTAENIENFKRTLMNHLSVIEDPGNCDSYHCPGFKLADGTVIEVGCGDPSPSIMVLLKGESRIIPLVYDYWGGSKTYLPETVLFGNFFGEEECRQILCDLEW